MFFAPLFLGLFPQFSNPGAATVESFSNLFFRCMNILHDLKVNSCIHNELTISIVRFLFFIITTDLLITKKS